MIEAIATSATADILVWVITSISGAIFVTQFFLLRATLQNKRLLTGEDAVDSDGGVIAKVRKHETRLDKHDDRIQSCRYGHDHKE
jgi:hypothetical protein